MHNLNKHESEGQTLFDSVPILEYAGTFSAQKPSETPTRLVSSHLNFALLEDYVVKQNIKTIHVRRDPRDVLVSWYHFYQINKALGPFEGSWNDFYELFMKKELLYGDVIDHVNGWLSEAHHSNILYISYEEMKGNLNGVIGRLASFCNLTVTEEQINYVAEKSTFKGMSIDNKVNGETFAKRGLYNFEKGKFMRKGVIGDWKNYFTEEQIEHMEERLKEKSQV